MSAKQTEQTDASRASATEQTDRGASINDMIMSIVETLSLLKSELMARWQVIEKLQAENNTLKRALEAINPKEPTNPA